MLNEVCFRKTRGRQERAGQFLFPNTLAHMFLLDISHMQVWSWRQRKTFFFLEEYPGIGYFCWNWTSMKAVLNQKKILTESFSIILPSYLFTSKEKTHREYAVHSRRVDHYRALATLKIHWKVTTLTLWCLPFHISLPSSISNDCHCCCHYEYRGHIIVLSHKILIIVFENVKELSAVKLKGNILN